MNLFISGLDPAFQIMVALFIAISVLSAIGVDFMTFLFRFFFVCTAGFTIWSHCNIFLNAFVGYQEGETGIRDFCSALYKDKLQLMVFMIGYIGIVGYLIQSVVDKSPLPNWFGKAWCLFKGFITKLPKSNRP